MGSLFSCVYKSKYDKVHSEMNSNNLDCESVSINNNSTKKKYIHSCNKSKIYNKLEDSN